MEIYLILTAVVVLLGIPLIEIKPSVTKKAIYIIIVFAFMLYITIFRYGLGNDYYSYIHIMRRVDAASFLKIFDLGYEPGFALITKLITLFTTNTDILYMVYGLLILVPTAYAIFRYSENLWMSTSMFICLTFFYCSLNFIRQAIAFAIILLAYKYFKEGNHFKVMLYIFIACLFHSTAIILIPIYLLAIVIKPTALSVMVYGVIFAVVYFLSWQILDLAVLILPQYKNYLELNFIQNGFSPVYLIVPTIIMLLALAAHFTGYGKAYPRASSVFTNFAIYNFFIWLISTKHFVIERFSMYVYIMMIFFLPSIATYYRKKLQIYLHNINLKKAMAEGKKIKRLRFDITVDEYIEKRRKKMNPEVEEAPEEAENEPEQIDEKEQQRLDIIKEIIGDDANELKSAVNEKSSDSHIPTEKELKYKPDENYLPENYKYKRKKNENRFISIIKHPAAVYGIFMAVAMVSCLWYNYFGLTVTSKGFHGAVPYRSTIPAYMEMTHNGDNLTKEEKRTWLRKEQNIMSYFYKMMESDEYTILIASKGDTTSGLNDGIRAAFAHLGFNDLANINYNENFAAIVSGGEIIYQSVSTSPLYFKDNVKGYDITLSAERNLSSIKIGSKDFSTNEKGLNIVVLDTKENKVIDKVRFKTYYVMLTATR
ncbi:MAG: EpsG family protein [Ruminiclostridium sp.]|nr:EpsG family protein [Ruminiclostridium sp.]